jgi:tRNA-specific 2-thiouridylase
VRDGAAHVVGHHDGVHRYTVGQRRGLGSLAPAAPGERPAPRYVVALDARAGRVTVGGPEALLRRELVVDEVVWWGEAPPASGGREAEVQIRHRHAPRRATVRPEGAGRARVTFAAPERAVAPGQAAVFYDGDRVLGGGFIADAS